MELNLVVPVEPGAMREKGDEEISGRLWRVTGPYKHEQIKDLKFHCISYVWGPGLAEAGSFFDCTRPISDKTRPALEAAIKAADSLKRDDRKHKLEKVEAFWIDALCVPQMETTLREKEARQATLESMGYIYSTALSVIIVLQGPIWNIIETAMTGESPSPCKLSELQVLEQDRWISRVWTYQELVNGADTYFTTMNPNVGTPVVQVQRFLNCVGASLNRWKKENEQGEMGVLETFPRLSILEDALGDMLMNGYLQRTALGVLSNIGLRDVDPHYPHNRLLACLGALTKEASWDASSGDLAQIADKLMKICEARNDYSFIYTSDKRSDERARRWRPSTTPEERSTQKGMKKPNPLIPIINWHTWTPNPGLLGATQNGHLDEQGLWLDNMVRLQRAKSVDQKAIKELEVYLFGETDPENPHHVLIGIFKPDMAASLHWTDALLKFLRKIGFTGCRTPLICDWGLFYPQIDIQALDEVEVFAASSIFWKFGHPGLARWKEDGVTKYCAGVYAGLLKQEAASVLML